MTEEPTGLQSVESQNCQAQLSNLTVTTGETQRQNIYGYATNEGQYQQIIVKVEAMTKASLLLEAKQANAGFCASWYL